MKHNQTIESQLKFKHVVKALPELTVDWNMNRYIGATASNTPTDDTEGYHVELFPIESIIEPNRPTKGVNKARIDQSTIGEDYRVDASGVSNGRFYVADEEDTYKYWTSPVPSDGNGNMPLFNQTNFPEPDGEDYAYDSLSSCRPTVIYDKSVMVNKIVITTENTWATAKTFDIQVTNSAEPSESDWTTVKTQASMGDDWKSTGQIVLWYNGPGSSLATWTAAGRSDNADGTPKKVSIRGVRFFVKALEGGYKKTEDGSLVSTHFIKPYSNGTFVRQNTTGNNSYFDLIEIGARLEADLSDYIISCTDNFEISASSTLYPMGTVTSNQGEVILSNLYKKSSEWVPGMFSRNNPDSPYNEFIEANAEFNLAYRYYDKDDLPIGLVQQFKMYADAWTGQATESVTVTLGDHSKFFNSSDSTLLPALWENLTVPQIVWRILDSIGFVDYNIDHDIDRVTEHKIPIFYTNGEQNVWEVLDELATASQTAIYFDEYGILQVKTRDFAFSASDGPVWEFNSEDTTNGLADIMTLDETSEFEPNHYKVIHQNTDWGKEVLSVPAMQQVWQPEDDTVTLRATPLKRDINADSTWLWIGADQVKFWPYEGLVNVDGELIRYKGKFYTYYTGVNGNTKKTKLLTSQDDYEARNSQTPIEFRHKNSFNGALSIEKRGEWNSDIVNHPIEATGYDVRQIVNGHRSLNSGGFYHDKDKSRVNLMSGPRAYNRGDIKLATKGQYDDMPFFHYGTRFRFLRQSGLTTQSAGLAIHVNGTKENGYFFEFQPSKFQNGKTRGWRDEFLFYSRVNGKDNFIARAPVAIGESIDYELDIRFTPLANGNHELLAWLNGKQIMAKTITGGLKNIPNGRFGMFLRGRSRAEFEYLYGIRREEESPLMEDFSFLDKVERGYRGGQWDREWVYRWKDYKRRVKKKWVKGRRRFNRTFFDEFGPIVHEVREYSVKFDPAPVLHSRLYMSNDWDGCAIEYSSSPFDAKFVIANTSRRNAIIHGEDTLSFSGTGDSINQVLTVFGRALNVAEAGEVFAENKEQIRRRGKIESEISSTWIQSKQMAQDIANWLEDNFSYGNENISIDIFGNPLVQLTDVVHVEYPDKHISGDYFVVGASTSYENGLATTLTLRRRL